MQIHKIPCIVLMLTSLLHAADHNNDHKEKEHHLKVQVYCHPHYRHPLFYDLYVDPKLQLADLINMKRDNNLEGYELRLDQEEHAYYCPQSPAYDTNEPINKYLMVVLRYEKKGSSGNAKDAGSL